MLSACQLIKRGTCIGSFGVSHERVIRMINQAVIYACLSLAGIASILSPAYSSGYVTAASGAVLSHLISVNDQHGASLKLARPSIEQPS